MLTAKNKLTIGSGKTMALKRLGKCLNATRFRRINFRFFRPDTEDDDDSLVDDETSWLFPPGTIFVETESS